MKLPRHLNFMYVPDDHARVRQFRVHRALVYGTGAATVCLALLAVFYVVGLAGGTGWRPGGSPLALENERLRAEIDHLEARMNDLDHDLTEGYEMQRRLAGSVDLEGVDPNVWQAGVGGREAPPSALVAGSHPALLDSRLDKLLRQARIHNECFESLVDSLDGRQQMRAHIPSIRPLDVGWVSSSFGHRKDPFTGKRKFHHGVDYSVPTGTPVRATAAGTVVQIINDRYGFGRMVKIDHGNGLVTIYGHLSKYLVTEGQQVVRGEAIAESGNSGRSTGPHLHYEVRKDKRRVDPAPYVLDSYASR